jgi:hypothetical protein
MVRSALFVTGTFFGIPGVALLTNSHVTGAELNPRSKTVWDRLNAKWTSFTPGQAPAKRRNSLNARLGALLPAHQAGTLEPNPSGRFLTGLNTVADIPLFAAGEVDAQGLNCLFGEIRDASGVVADAKPDRLPAAPVLLTVLLTG